MKILICVDNAPHSEWTVRFGSYVAQILHADATLLHVAHTAVEADAAVDRLAALQRHLPTANIEVRQGTAVTEIVHLSEEGNYNMIVVGAPTVHGLLSTVSHSVSHSLAAKAPVSVLVVRQTVGPISRILLCDSGLPTSRPVVELSARLARAAGATVRQLHVADPVPQMYIGLHTMEETAVELLASDTPIAQRLRWARQRLAAAGVPTETVLRHGIVLDEIVHETQSEAYDLLLLGAPRRQTLWQSLFIGKVAPRVVEQVTCPVLVVRY